MSLQLQNSQEDFENERKKLLQKLAENEEKREQLKLKVSHVISSHTRSHAHTIIINI